MEKTQLNRLSEMQYASLNTLVQAVVNAWPKHTKYLNKSIGARDNQTLETSNMIAEKVLQLADNKLDSFCKDYKWTCENLLEEELHFRRNGTYRFSKLEDVIDQVYNNDEYMRPYLNGLLLSQVLWSNHAQVFDYYLKKYLPGLPSNSRHLEVGPGHGLFLYYAANAKNIASVTGWDISPSSIADTEKALKVLDADHPACLKTMDIINIEKSAPIFDSIVMSELLEHIEDPHKALLSIRNHLSDDGFLFVNVPVNSPAPDHIYLLTTPEESLSLLSKAKYKIVDHAFFPVGGYSLEKARKNDLTVSCVIIAQK